MAERQASGYASLNLFRLRLPSPCLAIRTHAHCCPGHEMKDVSSRRGLGLTCNTEHTARQQCEFGVGKDQACKLLTTDSPRISHSLAITRNSLLSTLCCVKEFALKPKITQFPNAFLLNTSALFLRRRSPCVNIAFCNILHPHPSQ